MENRARFSCKGFSFRILEHSGHQHDAQKQIENIYLKKEIEGEKKAPKQMVIEFCNLVLSATT